MTPFDTVRWVGLCTLFVLIAGGRADAQANRFTGYEAEVHGSTSVIGGSLLRVRGVLYRVEGLATLRAASEGTVVAELSTGEREATVLSTQTVHVDTTGRFAVALTVPRSAVGARILRLTRVDSHGATVRELYRGAVHVLSPWRLDVQTDRTLYEPGETVHVWARLREVATGVPVANASLVFDLSEAVHGTRVLATATVRTSRAGVATLDVPVQTHTPEGTYTAHARLDDATLALSHESAVRVGVRAGEPWSVRAEIDEATVAPGDSLHGHVAVRSASGAPVRGADVEVRGPTDEIVSHVTTDARGDARFTYATPSYVDQPVEYRSLTLRAVHPAYGTAQTRVAFVMARVPFEAEIRPAQGALVPEVPTFAFVQVTTPQPGGHPPVGTPVRVQGNAVEHGVFRGATDRHGLVRVPMWVPRTAFALHSASDGCADEVATSVDLYAGAHDEFHLRTCLRVAPDAEVAVVADAPIVAPGGSIALQIVRGPRATQRPVVVDVMLALAGSPVLVSTYVAPGARRASLALPPWVNGIVLVRVRTVWGTHVAEGTGSLEPVLVRPARAFTVRLETEAPRYEPGSTARIVLHTPPGVTDGWAALVVRDLAADGGEPAFADTWLDHRLEQAVLAPETPDAERLVRAALSTFAEPDPPARPAPDQRAAAWDDDTEPAADPRARDDLRDPFIARDGLVRRDIVPVLAAVEAAVAAAAQEDSTGVMRRVGGRVAFDPGVIHTLVQNGTVTVSQARTLGGDELTVAMLSDAVTGFDYDHVARRAARQTLVQLLAQISAYVDPANGARSPVAGEPADRWLARMVAHGVIEPSALRDPWGGAFMLRRSRATHPGVEISARANGWELRSPGPDGVDGTADDVRDPFERVVPEGTAYAQLSGENALMHALASLDPGADVLAQMMSAYARVTDAAQEEEVGDVATARTAEGMITSGLGGGSGAGTIGVPRMGAMGHGSGFGSGRGFGGGGAGGLRGLGTLLRERFPATLIMVAERALDPSGRQTFDLPLAHAITTYRAFAIVWTADGWTTSGTTDVHVDQDVVVDAPLPTYATPGDRVRMPVRLANRSLHPVTVRVTVAAEGVAVGVPPRSEPITIAAEDSTEWIATLTPTQEGTGALRITVDDATSGAVRDAVRRPLVVTAAARPVSDGVEALAQGAMTVTLPVPANATFRESGGVHLSVGSRVFGDPTTWPVGDVRDATWMEWASAMMGRARPPSAFSSVGDLPSTARRFGAQWSDAAFNDAFLRLALDELTRSFADGSAQNTRTAAEVLIGVIPAWADATRRPDLQSDLRALVALVRRQLERDVATHGEDTEVYPFVAAALVGTGAVESPRLAEVVRRVARDVAGTHDERFVEGTYEDRVVRTAAYAFVRMALGDRATAFAMVRTVHAWQRRPRAGELSAWAMAAVTASRLTTGASDDTAARIEIDGVSQSVPVHDGVGDLPSRLLSMPGPHRVVVSLPSGVIVAMRADARYGVPWGVADAVPPPLALSLDGAIGARDTHAALVLRVQNHGPRAVPAAVVQVDLPAGAELDLTARDALQRRLRRTPTVAGRTLILSLRALAPGRVARLPLRLRWTVAGELTGLAVAASTSESPHAPVAVLPPRRLSLPDHGPEPVIDLTAMH